ncbi:MAG: hypothetical protein KDB92_03675 [Chitinophagaceae bacterium]|nr:hypothetical protein [Chitinophagaceae bacterium]
MTTLKIEHKISNYDGWKKAFDSDPIGRKKSGVKRYRIYQPDDKPDIVIIELDFDNIEQAQATQAALQQIFPNIEGKLIFDIKLSILNIMEEVTL